MHACRLAHDIASFFHGGTIPKVCLPCLMHKARVVTVLLFALGVNGEVAVALLDFALVQYWFGQNCDCLSGLRGASKWSKKVCSVCLSHI